MEYQALMAKLKAKRTGKARPGTGGKNRDRLSGKGATPKRKIEKTIRLIKHLALLKSGAKPQGLLRARAVEEI